MRTGRPLLTLALGAGLTLTTLAPAVASPGQDVTVPTPDQLPALAQSLVGQGVDVSNVRYTGAPDAVGRFSGMGPAVGMDEGVVLATGDAPSTILGPNDGTYRDVPSQPGDPALSVLSGRSTFDAAILEFDFVPEADAVTFDYIFGSEEYPGSVGSPYNDVFAFWVNGQNCATIGDQPVSINSVNGTTNSELFVPNYGTTHDTELNGFTTVLTCTALVEGGETNSLRMAIADAGDSVVSSAVLLRSGSLVSNNPPTAEPLTVSTGFRTPVAVTLVGADPDGNEVTYQVTQGPAGGTLSGTAPDLTFTPDDDFSGTTSFQYVTDDGTFSSQPATVTIEVANDLPPVADPVTVTTPFEEPVAIELTGTDPEGRDLTFQVTSQPSGGTLTGTAPELVFTPDELFSGSTSFTYTVSDGVWTSEPATVAITVASNERPTADALALSTGFEEPVSVTLSGSDPEDQPLTFEVGDVVGGTLTGTAPDLLFTPDELFSGTASFSYTVSDGRFTSEPAEVTIEVAANLPPTAQDLELVTGFEQPVPLTLVGDDPEGLPLTFAVDDLVGGTVSGTAPELVFTPDELFSGTASFSYTVSDGRFTSEAATVTIEVAANLPPTADDIELSTEFETPVEVPLTGTDPEGQSLTFQVGEVVGGTVTGTPPSLVFTPAERFGGTASITYTVSDGRFTSAPATVTIQVAANEPPSADDLRLETGFETPVGFTLPAQDPEGVPLQWALVGEVVGGSLSETDDSPRRAPLTEEERAALPPVTGGGWLDLVFTPDELFSGEASFSYVVFDGRFTSEPATVTIDVAANLAPTADDAELVTGFETPVAVELTGTDPEGQPLTFEVTSSPVGGTLSGTAPELTFTPDEGFSGTTSFEFTVSDGRFTSDPATVSIIVAAAPVEPTPTPTPTPAPVDPTPDPTPSPEPTPTPVDPTPNPVRPMPTPVEPMPTPVEPMPTPVEPTPAPEDTVEATPAPPVLAPSAPGPVATDRLPATGGASTASLVLGLGLLLSGTAMLLSRSRRRR